MLFFKVWPASVHFGGRRRLLLCVPNLTSAFTQINSGSNRDGSQHCTIYSKFDQNSTHVFMLWAVECYRPAFVWMIVPRESFFAQCRTEALRRYVRFLCHFYCRDQSHVSDLLSYFLHFLKRLLLGDPWPAFSLQFLRNRFHFAENAQQVSAQNLPAVFG